MSASTLTKAKAAATAKQTKTAPPPPLNETLDPDTLQKVSPGALRTVITSLGQRRMPGPKPELQPFARKVRDAMVSKNMSASDLARAVWGTTEDYRGYKVARNRDRIGHYLAGVSYPEEGNLKKLADALGLPVKDLALPEGTPHGAAREPRTSMTDTQITMLNAYPGVCVMQLRRLVSSETAMKIMQLLQEDVLPESVRGAVSGWNPQGDC